MPLKGGQNHPARLVDRLARHSADQIPIVPAGGPPPSGEILKYHSPAATVASRLVWISGIRSAGTGPPSSRIASGSHSSSSASPMSSSE